MTTKTSGIANGLDLQDNRAIGAKIDPEIEALQDLRLRAVKQTKNVSNDIVHAGPASKPARMRVPKTGMTIDEAIERRRKSTGLTEKQEDILRRKLVEGQLARS